MNIAIIGKPNAGKSSLLNRLAEIERAIVSPLPGTTRDTIEQQILIGGIPVRITDTAGIRTTGNQVEQEGIRRARSAANNADVVILIADATLEDIGELKSIAADLGAEKLLYVFNKIDLTGHDAGKPSSANDTRELYISAMTGAGVDALKQEITTMVAGADVSENSFIAHTRHLNILHAVEEALEQAAQQYQHTHAPELFAEDLSRAQRKLGELTGEYHRRRPARGNLLPLLYREIMSNFLFITLSNIGDALLTTPVLESLHRYDETATIDIVGDARSSMLFLHCPYRGEIYHKQKQRWLRGAPALLWELRRKRYEIVVDLRTDVLARLVRAEKTAHQARQGRATPRGGATFCHSFATNRKPGNTACRIVAGTGGQGLCRNSLPATARQQVVVHRSRR